ncbi:MAG: DUF5343 domain-containing protein [Chloroflexi bacterium]|nr:DUF5343 domain-containing protein [Chloroflexota bacterium]
MADFPYTPIPATLDKFFSQIQIIGKPPKITVKWLESIGLKSSNDRYLTGILKALGFTDASSIPTNQWQLYRNKAQARAVMARSIQQAYALLFETYPDAFRKDDESLKNFFSTHTDVGAQAIAYMVRTFKALVALADFDAAAGIPPTAATMDVASQTKVTSENAAEVLTNGKVSERPLLPISMNIQIVIPSDATEEQYDRIFSSIRKFLTKQG